jgi:hypothetical protein
MRQDISLLTQYSFSKSTGNKSEVMDTLHFIRDRSCLKVNIISKMIKITADKNSSKELLIQPNIYVKSNSKTAVN